MPLSHSAAESVVETWSQSASDPFIQQDRQDLIKSLIELAGHVTSHIVPDIALSSQQTDEILLDRTTACLEDWIAMVARSLRRQFVDEPNWRATITDSIPMGLKSVTESERIDLPVLGPKLAEKVAQYLALHPRAEFDDLVDVQGIGATGLNTLRDVSYLDRPSLGMMSPTILAFVAEPGLLSLITLMSTSDIRLAYGDWSTHCRRQDESGDVSCARRLKDFIDFASEQMRSASFVARGVLASEALATLERRNLFLDRCEKASDGAGALVVNAAYVAAAKSVIESATTQLSLMVFLGTDAGSVDGGVAPDALIDALETASASIDVRVILDQDDLDDPYLSKAINTPLLNRLKAAGVPVKFDEKNVLLHSKLLIADASTVLVGSHNWTRSGLNSTHEVSILAQQSDVAEAYQARFDALWDQLPA